MGRKSRNWQKIRSLMNLTPTTSSGSQLNRAFDQYFGPNFSADVLLARSNKTRGKRKKSMKNPNKARKRMRSKDQKKGGKQNHWQEEDDNVTPVWSPSMAKDSYGGIIPNGIDQDVIPTAKSTTLSSRMLTKKTFYIKGVAILPNELLKAVNKLGGIGHIRGARKWQKVREALKLPMTSSSGSQLNKAYEAYFEQETELSVLTPRMNLKNSSGRLSSAYVSTPSTPKSRTKR